MLKRSDNAMYMLAGPTAVGKSAVGHLLARRHRASMLSIDSMQVYRGMDLGTAKASPEEQREVVYGGIDLLEVCDPFDLSQYLQAAKQFFTQQRTVGPVFAVGGTGLYFNALIHGLQSSAGHPDRRDAYESLFEESGIGGLQQALQAADPSWYEQLSDKENPRRLIRALEQAEAGQSPSFDWKQQEDPAPMVVLRMEREALVDRIEQRVDAMLAGGLSQEVLCLLEQWPEWSPSALQSIGYKEMLEHLQGGMSIEETREQMIIRTRRLAKRQMTWFRHQGPVVWVDVDPTEPVEHVANRVEDLWLELGPTTVRVAD